jgi:hypothetical protein
MALKFLRGDFKDLSQEDFNNARHLMAVVGR